MLKKGVTLRGIEVFEALAQSGSVAKAAGVTGLSQPAVSQQMRNLETALGAELIDHSRRPMRLTPAGHLFLRRTGIALSELRQAQSDVTVMDLAHLEELNLGIIDDFDDELTPRLATILAESLTRCRFRLMATGSLELSRAIEEKSLHMAICAQPETPLHGVVEHPLVRDPFFIVAPAGSRDSVQNLLKGDSALPFMNYAKDLLIAHQIKTLLCMSGTPPAARFEISSHLALMAMVARGIGWSITTPLGYMRATRFHEGMRALPLPQPDAARQISLYAGTDWSGPVPRDIARTMRRLIKTHMIDPAVADLPWLSEQFHLMEDP
jgi:DNA-binding transcriptional LysR family regulator